MIHVIASIELVEGKREAFLAEFHRIAPLVRQEKGCQEYGPTVDVVTDFSSQVPYRDNVVTIVEKWESLETLQAHMNAPHMQEYRPRVKDLVKKVTLQVLQPG